ncbi:MAG TPA: hypothetical protein VJ140_19630 [Actinomycetota bacterium]|nr:hypothetical protein [Actinomycetota bacterium]
MAVADFLRITNHLEKVEIGDRASSFFELYPDAFLAMCEERSEASAGGSGFVVKLLTRGTAGPNPQYDLTGSGAPGRYRIELLPKNLEWKAKIGRDAVLGAMEKGATFAFDLIKEECDVQKHFTLHTLGKTLGGTGWGELAGIVAISTATVTVGHPDENASGATVPAYCNRFYEGQLVGSCDDLDSGNARGSSPGTYYTVATGGINRKDGQITFTATVSDFVDGDVMFEKGFRPYAASSGKRCVEGVNSWLSTAAIGGLTRSTSPGTTPIIYDASGDTTLVDALISGDEVAFSSGMPRKGLACMMHSSNFKTLQQGQEAKVTTQTATKERGDGSTYNISYSQFNLNGIGVLIPVVPSAFWTPGTATIGPFKDKERCFVLAYAGKAMHNLFKDGTGNAIRVLEGGMTDNDGNVVPAYVVEGYCRVQLLCLSPGSYLNIINLPSE